MPQLQSFQNVIFAGRGHADRAPEGCEYKCHCGCHGYDDCDCSPDSGGEAMTFEYLSYFVNLKNDSNALPSSYTTFKLTMQHV